MCMHAKILLSNNRKCALFYTIGEKDATRIIEIAAGGSAGVIILFVLVVFFIVCCYARRRRRRTWRGDFISHRTSTKGYEPLQMELEKKGKSKRKKTKGRKYLCTL